MGEEEGRSFRFPGSEICSPQELRVLFRGPASLDLEPAALGLEVSLLGYLPRSVRGRRLGLAEHVGEEPVGGLLGGIPEVIDEGT